MSDVKKRREQLRANRKRHSDIRASSRKKARDETRQLQGQLRQIVRDCGLTQGKLSDFSGIDATTTSRIMNGYHISARFTTIVAMLRAAGYRIEFIPIDPRLDEFREQRRLKPPPLD